MKVNLYDFDGTIYDGDSTLDFYLFCLRKKLSLIRFFPVQLFYLILFKIKFVKKKVFKEKFFIFLTGIDNIEKIINEFWQINDKKIKKWYLCQKQKSDIIISASPSFLLEPIAKQLKIKKPIATNIDVKNGKFISENCFGYEKVKRLTSKYPNVIIENFYTDSLNDLPLINLAKHSFIVRKNKLTPYTNNHKISPRKEIVNYLIVGFLTMFITVATYFVLTTFIFKTTTQLSIQLSNVISWICAVIFAYFANRKYVFKVSNNFNIVEMSNFFLSRLLTLGIDMFLMFGLTTFTKIDDLWIKIFVQIIVVVLNYVISKFVVFSNGKKKIKET